MGPDQGREELELAFRLGCLLAMLSKLWREAIQSRRAEMRIGLREEIARGSAAARKKTAAPRSWV